MPKPIRATKYNMNKLLTLRALAAGGMLYGLDFPWMHDADGNTLRIRKDVLAQMPLYLRYNSVLASRFEKPHVMKWYTINTEGKAELARLEAAIGHWWPAQAP